jgi:cold shock CspA family protein
VTSTGTVVAFDEHRGYGTVRAADGRELFFHCTAIADGTRRIPVGAVVVFAVVPGHRGTWEAAEVEALSASGGRTL